MVRIRSRQDGVYALHPSDVQHICKILEDGGAKVSMSVDCADDIQRTFATFEELDAYENTPSKQVAELSVSATKSEVGGPIDSCCVQFGREGRVAVDIEGDEFQGLYLRDQLLDVVEGLRPWYANLSKALSSDMVPVFLFGFLLVVAAFIDHYFLTDERPERADGGPEAPSFRRTFPFVYVSMFVIVLGPIAVGLFVLRRGQQTLFPKSAFALGQGAKRYEAREKMRWAVVGVATSIVIAVFVSLARRALV